MIKAAGLNQTKQSKLWYYNDVKTFSDFLTDTFLSKGPPVLLGCNFTPDLNERRAAEASGDPRERERGRSEPDPKTQQQHLMQG